jgi:hypothetical protein
MNAKSGSDGDSDNDSLFGSSSSSQPEKKRRRLNDTNGENVKKENGLGARTTTSEPKEASSGTVDPVLMEHAKSRLSKFAARLFDPNRIKVSR